METTTLSIEARLDRIEQMLEKITSMVDQAPPLVSMVMDTVDETIAQADKEAPIQERLDAAGELLKRISRPETLQGINKLIDFADQVPGLTSMAADTIDEIAFNSNQQKHGLQERLNGLGNLFQKLTDPNTMAKVEQLIALSDQIPGLVAMAVDTVDEVAIGTDLMGPQNMDLLKSAMKANQYANTVPPAKISGIFSLMRVLKDKEVQGMLGFMINFAKAFGKDMNNRNY
ncbi:MAG: DUF1641 domain-containing protein [Saprospiraceae bacterium]|nr:DUF1641 domain-containing protein [Saprospiraceae bacterium]